MRPNGFSNVCIAGRARADNAEYHLVAERGRGTIERDEANRLREDMMNEAVRFIGNMDEETFQRKTRELQEKAKVERDMAALGKIIRDEKKKAEHREGDYELRFVESFSQRFVETYCINFVFSAVILAVA